MANLTDLTWSDFQKNEKNQSVEEGDRRLK